MVYLIAELKSVKVHTEKYSGDMSRGKSM